MATSSRGFNRASRSLQSRARARPRRYGHGLSRSRPPAPASVALKVLHPELAYALGGDRFTREIEVAASLDHPHILPLFDSGEADGLLYYVMPYVEGESLRDRLKREGQLPLFDALQITREVADALAYAHGQQACHRDIKPENILSSGGHARVADFGIARALGKAGTETDSPEPGSRSAPRLDEPERGERRSPAWTAAPTCTAWAVSSTENLAGEPPYSGSTPQSVIMKRFTERRRRAPPPPPCSAGDPAPPSRPSGAQSTDDVAAPEWLKRPPLSWKGAPDEGSLCRTITSLCLFRRHCQTIVVEDPPPHPAAEGVSARRPAHRPSTCVDLDQPRGLARFGWPVHCPWRFAEDCGSAEVSSPGMRRPLVRRIPGGGERLAMGIRVGRRGPAAGRRPQSGRAAAIRSAASGQRGGRSAASR